MIPINKNKNQNKQINKVSIIKTPYLGKWPVKNTGKNKTNQNKSNDVIII